MTDVFSTSKRSEVMSRIRGKDTTPELQVRSIVHRLGYRFRLHVRDLPGSPDLVLPRLGTVIFVHGCFWHRCPTCNLGHPKTNQDYWKEKFERNVERDIRKESALLDLRWNVHTIWECEVESAEVLLPPLLE